jgi:hypothetical protein
MPSDNSFSGQITVSSRIVDYLSSGLYETPAACLKELINNSYDADAKTVNVFVKPDADRIIIEDDGVGMAKEEFIKHFSRISESHKRDDSSYTASNRAKIGKIGIGFIAANEICNVMEIYSTKAGSTDLLHVNINFDVMRLDLQERRREGGDVTKADYTGGIQKAVASEHFTRIFLKNVRGEARDILVSAKSKGPTATPRSLYGLSPRSIVKQLSRSDLKSWSEFDSYSQNLLRVALNVPVRYYDDWLPSRWSEEVRDIEKEAAQLGFSVYYDGVEIRKPIILRSGGDNRSLVSRFVLDGENVSAKGYFFARHGGLRPQDLNGILVRIRHSAVGDYDSSFLDFPSTEGALFQKWISAEIWADDKLEEAMNIDRKTLRIAHPAYVELQRAVHESLSQFIKKVRSEIFEMGRTSQNIQRARSSAESLKKLASQEISQVSRVAAREMVASVRHVSSDKDLRKRLIKKFSVEDLYRMVLEVAREVLSPSQLTKFIRLLTKRLTE